MNRFFKRVLCSLLVLTTVLSILFANPLLETSATDDKLSAMINLEVGTMSGSVFTPLASGTSLKTGDYIFVRISPKTDFYCGSSSFVIMFDKQYFSVVGTNSTAFTANFENTFYDQTASGYSGTTAIPDSSWPPTMDATENYNVYKAIRVGNQADSNSNNGGHPSLIPGTWLFRFKLKVLKEINKGDEARIFMDSRWFRSPTYTTGTAYFAKCETSTQLSSSGNSVNYNFSIDMTEADINLAKIAFPEISLNKESISMQYKTSTIITAATLPIQIVLWSSDNEKVATVDESGKVKAVGRGTATITATTEDGLASASCKVTVKLVWWQWIVRIILFGWIWY
ncbi:MAG: Ig-like domain-containing protein [Eubacteriales bacterium]